MSSLQGLLWQGICDILTALGAISGQCLGSPQGSPGKREQLLFQPIKVLPNIQAKLAFINMSRVISIVSKIHLTVQRGLCFVFHFQS